MIRWIYREIFREGNVDHPGKIDAVLDLVGNSTILDSLAMVHRKLSAIHQFKADRGTRVVSAPERSR